MSLLQKLKLLQKIMLKLPLQKALIIKKIPTKK
jgi:hypothetical protein